MKYRSTISIACFLALFCTAFYACKKNQEKLFPSGETSSKLPPDLSSVADWYDRQIYESIGTEFVRNNKLDWSKAIKLEMPNGTIVYASKVFSSKSVIRELNINKLDDNELFGIIKEYEVNNNSITLRIYSLTGRLLEDGFLKENGNYVRRKIATQSTMKSMGGSDGNEIGIDEDGNPIVIITPSNPSPSTPLPSFPSQPTFPSNPGGPSLPGGGGGAISPPSATIFENFKNYPCAKKLVQQLPTLKTDIAARIKEVFAKNDLVNITFEELPNLAGSKIDGRLISSSGSNYVIGINTDVLGKASKEYILVTLYHEALHAYLAEKERVLGKAAFDKQYQGVTIKGGRLIVQDSAHIGMGFTKYLLELRDAITSFNSKFNANRALSLASCGITILSSEQATHNAQERDTSKPGYQGSKCP